MKYLVISLGLFLGSVALAADRYHVENLVLLQPDEMMRLRICSVEEFASYLTSLNSAADAAIAEFDAQTPTSGFIVVAVRPNGLSKAWTDFNPKLTAAEDAAVVAALEQVTPFKALHGTVLAGARVTLWGAQPTSKQLPNPEEWRAGFMSFDEPTEVTDMVDSIWPFSTDPQSSR